MRYAILIIMLSCLAVGCRPAGGKSSKTPMAAEEAPQENSAQLDVAEASSPEVDINTSALNPPAAVKETNQSRPDAQKGAAIWVQRQNDTSTNAIKKPMTSQELERLRNVIELDVAAGFLSEEAIATNAVNVFSEDYDVRALGPRARAITRQFIDAHKREQSSWPKTTDCDRLDAAFAELERKGVVCRQNFSCCGTCGPGEMAEEMEKVTKNGGQVRGYAYYHVQNTESAVLGGGLYLGYGAAPDDKEAAAVLIGKEVAEALKRHGLKVDWDGTWATRIGVKLDWKRRR